MVASYPFDDSASHDLTGHYSRSADDALFRYLARTYADHNPIMRTGRPQCPDTPNETFEDGITNGAQWYDVPGKGLPAVLSLNYESMKLRRFSVAMVIAPPSTMCQACACFLSP